MYVWASHQGSAFLESDFSWRQVYVIVTFVVNILSSQKCKKRKQPLASVYAPKLCHIYKLTRN